MFENVREDLRAYQERIGGSRFRRRYETMRAPGVQAVIVYRFGRSVLRVPLLFRLFLEPVYVFLYHRMRSKWGIEIMRQAEIGEGFIVQHQGGVFIGAGAVIGKHVVIHHDVTIGVLMEGMRRGAPTIEDNVIIAPGAKVFGKIRIGSRTKIGPNVVILKNIPEDAIVSNPEPQILRMKSASQSELPSGESA